MSGAITYANYTISGTSASIHNVTAITGCAETCVINFTMYATDTNSNVKQNSTLLVVADVTKPVINGTLNKSISSIFQNVIINDTGSNRIFNFTNVNGQTTGTFSQNFTVSCSACCVVNVTGRVNDTAG